MAASSKGSGSGMRFRSKGDRDGKAMTQPDSHMQEDGPEQEALFFFEGPDEDGCVWIYGASTSDPWAQNLGPCRKVAEVMLKWLVEIDPPENDTKRQSRRERMDAWDADVARLDKRRLSKIPRPDHREEGGQG